MLTAVSAKKFCLGESGPLKSGGHNAVARECDAPRLFLPFESALSIEVVKMWELRQEIKGILESELQGALKQVAARAAVEIYVREFVVRTILLILLLMQWTVLAVTSKIDTGFLIVFLAPVLVFGTITLLQAISVKHLEDKFLSEKPEQRLTF